MADKREYSSAIRDEAKKKTRDGILNAVVRVVIDEGVHAFSVANVAKHAGVSHRTVYRHFASREELLEGLADSIDAMGPPPPADGIFALRELVAASAALFEGLERIRDAAAAEFIISVALGYMLRGKRARWATMKASVAAKFPALPPDEQVAGAAALRALLSTNAWFHLCVQLGVPAEVAARGASHAAMLVLEDLERRNAQIQTDPK